MITNRSGSQPPKVTSLVPMRATHVGGGLHPDLVAIVQKTEANTTLVQVRVKDSHAEGAIAGSLQMLVNGLPVITPLRGHVWRGIRPVPDYFNFGKIDPVENFVYKAELIPIDGKPFKIKKIDVLPGKAPRDMGLQIEQKAREGGGYTLLIQPAGPVNDDAVRLSGRFRFTPTIPTNLLSNCDTEALCR